MRRFGVFCLLAIAIAGAYANALENGFVFDDFSLVVNNAALPRIAADPSLVLTPKALGYRPVRTLSYVVDYHLSGVQGGQLDAWFFHLNNIVYHWLTACVVFLIALRLTNIRTHVGGTQAEGEEGMRWQPAVFTALLWALHPLQVETVTYISGRRDILTTLFFLCGFWAFLGWREQRTVGKRIACFLAIVLSYVLGVASKEMALTLPLVMLGYDGLRASQVQGVSFGPRYMGEVVRGIGRGIGQHKFLYGPLLLLGVYFAWYAAFVILPTWAIPWYGGGVVTNFLTVARIWVYYLFLLCAPIHLLADYTGAFPITLSAFDPLSWLAVGFLLSLGLMVLVALRFSSVVAFALAWVAMTLLPVSHIIPHPEVMAEHYLYLPSVGFCLLVGLGFAHVTQNQTENRWISMLGYGTFSVLVLAGLYVAVMSYGETTAALKRELALSVYALGFYLVVIVGGVWLTNWRREKRGPIVFGALGASALAVLLAFYTVRTVTRNRDWRDDLSFYAKMVEDNPISCRARLGLGYVADRSGLARMAIAHYRRGIRLCPGDPRLHTNVGAAYQKLKMLRPAKQAYQEALRLQPNSSVSWNNLGFLYIETGEFAQAHEALQKAEQLSAGQDLAVYANLGIMHEMQGQYAQALAAYQKGLQLAPEADFYRQKVEVMREQVAQSTDSSGMR